LPVWRWSPRRWRRSPERCWQVTRLSLPPPPPSRCSSPRRCGPKPPTGFSLTERRNIENAIRLQIRAYAARDAKQAFAKLAPSTQRFFGEPDRFLRSLAQDMPTVLDTRRFAFLGVEQVGQRTVQQVLITDSTEHEWLAEFQLEQMKSGDWRVKGCILQSTPGQQA